MREGARLAARVPRLSPRSSPLTRRLIGARLRSSLPHRDMKIGYLVPEFPGQTHAFFWREIRELERLNITVDIVSTRPPNREIISHTCSEDAQRRTTHWAAGFGSFPYAIGGVAAVRPGGHGCDVSRCDESGRAVAVSPENGGVGAAGGCIGKASKDGWVGACARAFLRKRRGCL